MINETNLFSWWGTPHHEDFYREWTGPFLVAYERQRARRSRAFWPWDLSGAVEPSLDDAWAMTGKWLARRAKLVDRAKFDAVVPQEVAKLSAALNTPGVAHLRGLAELASTNRAAFGEVIASIHDAVLAVSEVKPTDVIQPVFGSKVLHHFFPSIVPVFDMAYVRRGVMRLDDFADFMKNERQDWICWEYKAVGGNIKRERVLEDFRRYLDYCIAWASGVDARTLGVVRERFARMLLPCAPTSMRRDTSSLLWNLDAKLIEWSLCGAAKNEGKL